VVKRLSVLASLAVLGVGAWLVSRGQEVDRVCKVNTISGNGGNSFSHCTNLISTYFLGYALCILGFILLLMSIFVIRQHSRQVKPHTPKRSGDEQQPDDSNPFRAVMKQEKDSGKTPEDGHEENRG